MRILKICGPDDFGQVECGRVLIGKGKRLVVLRPNLSEHKLSAELMFEAGDRHASLCPYLPVGNPGSPKRTASLIRCTLADQYNRDSENQQLKQCPSSPDVSHSGDRLSSIGERTLQRRRVILLAQCDRAIQSEWLPWFGRQRVKPLYPPFCLSQLRDWIKKI